MKKKGRKKSLSPGLSKEEQLEILEKFQTYDGRKAYSKREDQILAIAIVNDCSPTTLYKKGYFKARSYDSVLSRYKRLRLQMVQQGILTMEAVV